MATNIPRSIPDLINWTNTHAALWEANQAQIGLTAAQVTQFKALQGNLSGRSSDADIARQASKDATLTLKNTVEQVRSVGGAFVNVIKAFAVASNNPAVYTLSGVSPDDPAGTVPPPIPPKEFAAQVNSDGSLTIRFKVAQPEGVTGVQYFFFRRIGGGPSDAPYTLLGSTGKSKAFTDETLPIGVDRVDYIVQPKRGEIFGEQSNIFALQFGSVGGPGLTIASMDSKPHASPVKIAA